MCPKMKNWQIYTAKAHRHKKQKRTQLKTGGETATRGQQELRMQCSLKEQLTDAEF